MLKVSAFYEKQKSFIPKKKIGIFFKGPIFTEKDGYYLQVQTDMPLHYLKLILWIFPPFLQVAHCKNTDSADSQLLKNGEDFEKSSLR